MKTKKNLKVGICIIFPIMIVLVMYFVLAFYYQDSFSYGTWINGVYCTGRSVEQVNQELVENTVISDIVIVDQAGNKNILSLKEIDYNTDYTSQLNNYIHQQNPFLWIDNLTKGQSRQLEPTISYDEEKLSNALQQLSFVKESTDTERNVRIVWTEEGYVLENGMENVLNVDKLLQIVKQSLNAQEYEIRIDETDCYENLELTAQMQETLKLWKKVEKFQQCNVTYDFGGELIPVTLGESSLWILTDAEGRFILNTFGNPQVDEEAVAEYVSGLALKYDTYGKTRNFMATCGQEVVIEGGTYGSQMDQKKEVEYLIQAFTDKTEEIHIPSYKKKSGSVGSEDIGDTYIEVDLTDQKMYYYEDGELMLETDVVTGNMKKGNDTPAGVNYVYAKQRNRTLRGADYESFVRFWMPVAGNIGIHDASWRNKFGGEIYMTNGSHGCINTPSAKMEKLFDMVEIGVPVVMFYHD